MKTRRIITSVLILSLAIQGQIYGQSTQIKTAEITFEFPSKNVSGTIEGFESSSTIDFNNLEGSKMKGAVDSKTLDTNNFLRNISLRSGRYFDVKNYPKIYFESSSIRKQTNGFKVIGTLTMKGTSKPLEINFKEVRNKLLGNTSLYSSDYGITIKKERTDNLVKVNFSFELQ
ncbi:YceI family protein [Croceivirga thetidis]|uniref:YceI family protein n=1 Tax=Croceivirga thetidis TaxID=2721623 RepID=A0ABX1GQZ8_9FLAO|nr:YceI family protein [Croceivirga thetidis]NKI32360.1 YceI family protein [Croceivirga thetidis]